MRSFGGEGSSSLGAPALSAAPLFGRSIAAVSTTSWSSTRSDDRRNGATSVPLRFADYVDADDFADRAADRGEFGDRARSFHFGACSSTTESDAGVSHAQQLRVHEAARALGRGAARAVRLRFVGGDLRRRSKRCYPTRCRLRDLRPLNTYGYSKHLFDLYAQRSGLDRTDLRHQVLQRLRSERRS